MKPPTPKKKRLAASENLRKAHESTMENLRKACNSAESPELYLRVVAYRAALASIRATFKEVGPATEIAKATLRLEL